MKRRSFLGFLGAGAAAGPSMAKSAIKSIPGLPGGIHPLNYPSSIGSAVTSSANMTDDAGWKIERIAELKSIISGQQSEEKKRMSHAERIYQARALMEQNVLALHSCSAGAKVRMIQSRQVEIDREASVRWAEFNLWQIMMGKMG